jgi:hypothetical protein
MYDVYPLISSRTTSTSSNFISPSYSNTNKICQLDTATVILTDLDEDEKKAIMNEPNQLWKSSFKGLKKAVSVGSTETVVDDYVKCVIESVANALKLDIRLEQQSYINANKADHWVVAADQDSVRGRLVGCNEDKLPKQNFGTPYVLENNAFCVQIHSQMMEVFNYYGTTPVFEILILGVWNWKYWP